MKSKQIKNSLLLIIGALIWGAAFVAQSAGGDAVGPYAFNSVRFIIGSIVLWPVIMTFDKLGISTRKPETAEAKRYHLVGGAITGLALCLASCSQQMGITLGSNVGKAGFVTTCYILIVPIMGIFIKKKCGWNIWLAVAIALAGLYFLCINGSFLLEKSDLLLLACAFLFSIQILCVDHFSPKCDPIRLSSIEFMVCGLLSAIPMILVDIPAAGGIGPFLQLFTSWSAWGSILYAGVLSSGVAYTLQVVAQPGLNPTVASLIMSLESVFATLFGWLLLHQVLSLREAVGCLLMFVAIVLAQLPLDKMLSKRNK